jgi:hypothetical protein
MVDTHVPRIHRCSEASGVSKADNVARTVWCRPSYTSQSEVKHAGTLGWL